MDAKDIERSIIKTYKSKIYGKFLKAIKEYNLVQDKDKIAVCISGGKDSFLLAKCMQELKRHSKYDFDLKFIVMNPGYAKENIDLIKENLQKLEIDAEIYKSNIFEEIENATSPCYLCARKRRGFLYAKAQELGCNKIALGHHFNDVIETTLLSILYGAETKTMVPKLHSDNFEGLELIRPLYLVKEEDVISWKKFNELEFLNCACKFTEQNYKEENKTSKRLEIKNLIKQLKTINPDVDYNIFKSMDNINLNCVLGYSKNGKRIEFVDDYENRTR